MTRSHKTERLRDFLMRHDDWANEILLCHHRFFQKSIYKRFTWNPVNAMETILAMANDDDYEIIVSHCDGEIVGFFEFATENPWMDEKVALCVNFYVDEGHAICSQFMLDAGRKICQAKGAKLIWQSSTAGFADNGVNERAFKMFLKRNGFREVGTFLVLEIGNEQGEKGGQESR